MLTGTSGTTSPPPASGMMMGGMGLDYGALGKKKAIISEGMLGCMKQRIRNSMLDAIPGSYKILICDRQGAEIISTCLRMHELMEHGVTLVEDLFLDRQPVISSPALYFIAPEDESVAAVILDWTTKAPYQEAHIFFTGVAPDRMVDQLARAPRLPEKVRSVKDMMLDFMVPESLHFHFNLSTELPKLFPPEIALSGGRDNILGQVSTRLVSVFFTLGCGVPTIRYQATSRLAQQVARQFLDGMAKLAKDVPDIRIGVTTPDTPLLIIVDRSFDAVEPLVHERTYQCMLDDLMPLDNNLYRQDYVDRNGSKNTRMCPVDQQDPYWCRYRHEFFTKCLEELPKQLQDLIAANPSLANGMQHGGKLSDLGNAVRALPEFQEKQAKLSMHIDICTKLMDKYRQQRLAEVCEVEQDMAAERKSFKENYDAVVRLGGDSSIPLNVRLRMVLMLMATTNTREFTEAKKQQLLSSTGLSSEAQRCANLEILLVRTGKLRQSAGTDTPLDAGKSSSPVKRSLRLRRTSTSTSSGNGSFTSSPGQGNEKGDPFRNQAYLIAEAAVNNTLNTSDFPTLNGGGASAVDALAGAGRRTLRSGLAKGGTGATDGMGGGGGARNGENLLLDLGFEGQLSLTSSQRIVLFVLGGVTSAETRAAYDVGKKFHREVIIGSTSQLQPEVFVTELSSLR